MRFSKIIVMICIVFLMALTIPSYALYYIQSIEPPMALLGIVYGGFCAELALTFAATASGNKTDTAAATKKKTETEEKKIMTGNG